MQPKECIFKSHSGITTNLYTLKWAPPKLHPREKTGISAGWKVLTGSSPWVFLHYPLPAILFLWATHVSIGVKWEMTWPLPCLELPVSRNYQHGGWEKNKPFFNAAGSPVSASRTYDIYNQNGWGRSLHFLSAWILVFTGLVYLLAGFFSGHFRKHLWPRVKEFRFSLFWRDFANHFRRQVPANNGVKYGLLQKSTYTIIVFFLLPLTALTGLAMSPAIAAAYPFLTKMFFGAQSARTIHFFASVALVLFLVIHVVMVIRSGFKQQMRAMTIGK